MTFGTPSVVLNPVTARTNDYTIGTDHPIFAVVPFYQFPFHVVVHDNW